MKERKYTCSYSWRVKVFVDLAKPSFVDSLCYNFLNYDLKEWYPTMLILKSVVGGREILFTIIWHHAYHNTKQLWFCLNNNELSWNQASLKIILWIARKTILLRRKPIRSILCLNFLPYLDNLEYSVNTFVLHIRKRE